MPPNSPLINVYSLSSSPTPQYPIIERPMKIEIIVAKATPVASLASRVAPAPAAAGNTGAASRSVRSRKCSVPQVLILLLSGPAVEVVVEEEQLAEEVVEGKRGMRGRRRVQPIWMQRWRYVRCLILLKPFSDVSCRITLLPMLRLRHLLPPPLKALGPCASYRCIPVPPALVCFVYRTIPLHTLRTRLSVCAPMLLQWPLLSQVLLSSLDVIHAPAV